MMGKNYFGAVALLSACIGAWAQDATWVCDGRTQPNYDDCRSFIDEQGWADDSVGILCPAQGQCAVYTPTDDRNCRAAFCNVGNACGTYATFATDLGTVLQWCVQESNAGGKVNSYEGSYSELTNSLNSGNTKRSSGLTKRGAHLRTMTIGENEAELEALARVIPSVKARHPRDFTVEKRQSPPDSDTSFNLIIESQFVEQPGVKYSVTGRIPAGSQYTISETDTQETSVSSSVEVGANLFEIFTASVSITVEQSYSVSSSVGANIQNNCPGEGIVYWYPLFNSYEGVYEPSGTQVTHWIPLDSQESKINYRVECVG